MSSRYSIIKFDGFPAKVVRAAQPWGIYDSQGDIFSFFETHAVEAVMILVQPAELSYVGEARLDDFYKSRGITVYHHPFDDHIMPDIQNVRAALMDLEYLLKTTNCFAVHCSAGVARTGNLLCLEYAKNTGAGPEETIRWIEDQLITTITAEMRRSIIFLHSKFFGR